MTREIDRRRVNEVANTWLDKRKREHDEDAAVRRVRIRLAERQAKTHAELLTKAAETLGLDLSWSAAEHEKTRSAIKADMAAHREKVGSRAVSAAEQRGRAIEWAQQIRAERREALRPSMRAAGNTTWETGNNTCLVRAIGDHTLDLETEAQTNVSSFAYGAEDMRNGIRFKVRADNNAWAVVPYWTGYYLDFAYQAGSASEVIRVGSLLENTGLVEALALPGGGCFSGPAPFAELTVYAVMTVTIDAPSQAPVTVSLNQEFVKMAVSAGSSDQRTVNAYPELMSNILPVLPHSLVVVTVGVEVFITSNAGAEAEVDFYDGVSQVNIPYVSVARL